MQTAGAKNDANRETSHHITINRVAYAVVQNRPTENILCDLVNNGDIPQDFKMFVNPKQSCHPTSCTLQDTILSTPISAHLSTSTVLLAATAVRQSRQVNTASGSYFALMPCNRGKLLPQYSCCQFRPWVSPRGPSTFKFRAS